MNLKYFLIAALSFGVASGTMLCPDNKDSLLKLFNDPDVLKELNSKLSASGCNKSAQISDLVQLQILDAVKGMKKDGDKKPKTFKEECLKVFKENIKWMAPQVIFWGSVCLLVLQIPVVGKLIKIAVRVADDSTGPIAWFFRV